jgi:hypothetical protein
MRDEGGGMNFFLNKNKTGQVTIFVIIAIVIVAGIVAFFVFRQGFQTTRIPASVQPAYNTFLSCLEDKTLAGISILESQGGYIELPEFEPGNNYAPFSSQLNAFGSPIPYWQYVSGSGIQKEQVPSESDMEASLGSFIEGEIKKCYLGEYYAEGFEIVFGSPKAVVDINSANVNVNLDMDMTLTKGNDTVAVSSHEITVNSDLGSLYSSAKKIYDKEQKELFLENYGIDTLRLYAPVDGVKISCSPETWNAEQIFSELKDAIETNTLALTTNRPADADSRYFYIDAGVGESVRFVTSRNWANSFEVLPADEAVLVATPVGNQQGLGVIGFCYVPYHFVYNVNYPVLVQVYNRDEVFQFPLAVVIQGNKPRTALNAAASNIVSDLCLYKNSPATVNTLDSDLNSVDAQIFYECLGESCFIGESKDGTLTANFPQCTNGYIAARANGFKENRFSQSTVQAGSTATLILDRVYSVDLELKADKVPYAGNALIYFEAGGNSKTVSYPEQKKVSLSEGDYEVSVYLYRDSSIQLRETTSQQCIEVPNSGIGSLFGLSQEKCFDVTVPNQIVSDVLAGGGKQNISVFETILKTADAIEINVPSFAVPTTIEQLQNNYVLFEQNSAEVIFR